MDKKKNIYAMKQFKPKKSPKTFMKEVTFQKNVGVLAPKVIDYTTETPPRLVMEKMDKTLEELIISQDGKLTTKQQKNLIELSNNMDKLEVYHNDPNPLNIMVDFNGKFRFIDYGMSKMIDPKKNGVNPNLRALFMSFYGGVQGLVTRKIIKKENIKIINDELKKIEELKELDVFN